ncbi:hypothetical protein [Pseudoroseomonas cervicalis]|uniref:hypothetical protein n=1 Tax=Teichococcus cervicalis TaxID=204525 RepID=UPI0022F1A4C6|nr:hypothetical protein [Pseudoroseomonas cervicalis]WBV43269.1 hypothetical protein PFY06_01470 [Pseudoroseomonas cervicalis]
MNEFETLRELIRQDRIQLGVDIRKMNSPGSPAYRPFETLALPVTILVASFLGAKYASIHVGAVLLAAGMAYWLLKVQPKVKEAVFARTAELALSREALFDGLWAKGALTLHTRMPDGSSRMANRKNNWRDLVRLVVEQEGGAPPG